MPSKAEQLHQQLMQQVVREEAYLDHLKTLSDQQLIAALRGLRGGRRAWRWHEDAISEELLDRQRAVAPQEEELRNE
jgi:hypothetical protein